MGVKDKAADNKAADSETTGTQTQVLFVSSISKDGFRRIGRWFGPDEERVEVTPEQAAALASVPSHLRVYTPEAKAQLDELAAGPRRPARPAPRDA